MKTVLILLCVLVGLVSASEFDPEWGHPLYAKNLRVGSTFRDSTTVNWAYVDSLYANYATLVSLDSLEKVYIDTLTVGDTLCVKGPSRFEMDMIADSNLAVGDSAYFADDVEVDDTLFVSTYGDIQDAIVNNKLTVTDSLEIGTGIDAASAWGHFDSLDTDHIALGVNLLGSGAYGVLDSLDTDHIDLGVNLLGSGAYADLDSVQSDHYTGTNIDLSGWLNADSVDADHGNIVQLSSDTLDTRALLVDTVYGMSPIHVMDSTYLEEGIHLADDDSLRVYSDKFNLYIEQDQSLSAGDRDMGIYVVEEDGNEYPLIFWNDGVGLVQIEDVMLAGDLLWTGSNFEIDIGGGKTILNPGRSLTQNLLLGGDDKDSIVVQANDSLVVEGVAYLHEVNVLDVDSATVYWFDSKELIAPDMWAGSSAPAQNITGVSPTWRFDPFTDEEVYTSFYLGNSYQDGEDFTISLEWAPTSTDANTVTWGIEYNITPISGTSAIGATTTVITTQDASGTRGDLQQTLGWTISGTGVTGDSWVGIRIFRDADASETGADDDYPDDAYLVSLTATIPCDKLE
jgi:hypothetical protein